VRYHN